MASLAPVTNDFGVGPLPKDLFPDLEISRNMRIAIGFPFEAGKQNEEVGALTEYPSGRGGLKIGSAKIFIEALEAAFFCEVVALRVGDAGQDIEVGSEPAVIFGKQAGNEVSGVFGASSCQFFPGDLGPGSPRDNDMSGAYGYLAAVEVECGGVGKQSSQAGGVQQGGSGFTVVFGERPVQTSYRGIVDEVIHYVDVALFLYGA